MQYHSEYRQPGAPSKDRTPWHIQERSGDDRVVPIYRFFAKLRMQLIPYLASEAAWCVARGEPLLRPLLLDDGADPVTWRIVDQFRLGRDLLVAPVVEEGATPARSTCRRANGRTSGPAPLPPAANGTPFPPRSTASQSTSVPAPT